jgi:peptidoglycan/xylan/chitin deacetylase (PgdA/CDA1 family)
MKIPILMYHQTDTPPPRGTALRGLVVSPAAFSRQMQILRWFGYTGLSLRELEPYLREERQGKVLGITMDDGYRNNLEHALPALRANGHSATCYAVSSLIGGKNVWDAGIGVAQKDLMSLNDWLAWIAAGMDVGSHSCSHADLTTLSPDDARAEIRDSRLELARMLNYDVRHFCYPYGRFTQAHADMVRQAGYLTATTTRRGRVLPGDDFFHLRRVLVAHATTPVHLMMKVMTRYEDARG